MLEISEHNREPSACRSETNVMTRYVSVGVALQDIAGQGLLVSAFINVALVRLLPAQDNRYTEKYSDTPPGGIRTHFGSFLMAVDSRGLRRRGLLSAPDAVTICNSFRGVLMSCGLLLSMSGD